MWNSEFLVTFERHSENFGSKPIWLPFFTEIDQNDWLFFIAFFLLFTNCYILSIILTIYFLATTISVNANSIQNPLNPQTPQRVATRERRQRSNEERRDGSGRRRTPRNRNSVNLQPPPPAGPQTNGAINGITGNHKIDLPPGYGKFFCIRCN